jgi:hypothetical protein
MEEAKVIEIIKTKSSIGDGTKENPVRLVIQYWDFQGNLLFSHDTLHDNEVISSQ